MKKTTRWIIGIAITAALNIGAQTIVPSAFNYQGVLRAGDGTALGEGNQQIEFRLYKEATAGDAVWGRMYTVVLDANGLFNVELEDGEGSELVDAALLDVIADAAGELFIGITVVGDEEIAPRQQLLSVPYALTAGDVREARNDFAVQGALSVYDGGHVDGTFEANEMVINNGEQQTTLTANNSGSLTTSEGLHVNGDFAVEGTRIYFNGITLGADGSQELVHVHGTTKTDGLIVENNSTFNGSTTILKAPEYADAGNTWSEIFTDTVIMSKQDTDGLITIELMLKQDGSSDNKDIRFEIKTGSTSYDTHLSTLSNDQKTQNIITLPVRAGEDVLITKDTVHSGDYQCHFRARFFAFGL